MTKKEIQDIIEGIRAGKIKLENLPRAVYLEIYDQLEANLVRGMKIPPMIDRTPKKLLDTYFLLSDNLKSFAAHKTYQLINSMKLQASTQEMGQKWDLYMKTWQKTENDLVVKQSMTVNDWYIYESQKDVMPYLRYVTALDERVRHEHAALHGIIKKVESPFWNEFMPANGYNCRCTVEQLDIATESTISSNELSTHRKNIDLKFRNNPAKSGFIFKEEGKDKHSYFKVPKEAKKAIDNLVE